MIHRYLPFIGMVSIAMLQPIRAQEPQPADNLPSALKITLEGQEGPAAYRPSPDDDELTRMRKQQVNIRQARVKLAEMAYRQGSQQIGPLLQAQLDLLEARMGLAQTVDEQLQIYGEQVAIARQLERYAIEQFQAGMLDTLSLNEATDARLAAEIELLEFKQRQQPAGLNSQAAEPQGQHSAMPMTGMLPASCCAGDFASSPARCFRPILRRW